MEKHLRIPRVYEVLGAFPSGDRMTVELRVETHDVLNALEPADIIEWLREHDIHIAYSEEQAA